MKKSIVLYVGNFSFPNGNAAGKRVLANGKIMQKMGREVVFIGMSKEVTDSLPLKNTKTEYEGFTYYNFPYPKSNLDWVNYNKTYKKLVDLLESEELLDGLDLVIYYGSPSLSLFNMKLMRYCKERDIRIVADCVDWLIVKSNNILFNLIKWADNTYQKAYLNKRTDGIITISKYLSDYYRGKGCNTVIIPPLSTFIKKDMLQERTTNDAGQVIIMYAGLPFRIGSRVVDPSYMKDRIDKTILLLWKAKKSGCSFIFNVYGFTRDDYIKSIPSQEEYVNYLGLNIVFHGFKNNDEIVGFVEKSDFTILIRDVNRATMAGFPTKISESISCGTPVITNQTSDLKDYIVEGENGYFLNMDNVDDSFSRLVKILKLERHKIISMKNYCNENNIFYFSHFENDLKTFFNLIDVRR
ncbi:glycosyltransferase [Paenibacillus sp. 2TAB23]|uniref:glycosyltransferase n=1 Tax=Paenibacillus sp. 2TAB23 TaxID=3233004 RepID=UPI003F94B257